MITWYWWEQEDEVASMAAAVAVQRSSNAELLKALTEEEDLKHDRNCEQMPVFSFSLFDFLFI